MVQKARGFTIVELLIVIVVIGILAGLSYIVYGDVQRRANISVTKADLASIKKGLEVYNIDHETFPVASAEVRNGDFGVGNEVVDSLDDLSRGYYYVRGENFTSANQGIHRLYVTYWDFGLGQWSRDECRFVSFNDYDASKLGWDFRTEPAWVRDPDTYQTPCRAARYQECIPRVD